MTTGFIMQTLIYVDHQFGDSVAESQTFLLAKCPKSRGARRNGCFRRLLVQPNGHYLAKTNQFFQNPVINRAIHGL